MSLKYKTIIGVALIEACLLMLLVWHTMSLMRSSNETLFLQRADTTTQLFISMIKDPILAFDLATLETSVEQLLTGEGIDYVKVWGYDQLLTTAGNIGFVEWTQASTVATGFDEGGAVYRVVEQISVANENYGQVEIGFNSSDMQQRQGEAIRMAGIMAIIAICLSALFSFFLGSWIVNRLEQLHQASKALAKGEYGIQIPVQGRDEIAQTVNLFNSMSKEVKLTADEMRDLNKSLEYEVVSSKNELAYSNQAFDNVIEVMSDAMIVVDQDGDLLRANPAFEEFTGIEQSSWSDFSLATLLHTKDRITVDHTKQWSANNQQEMLLKRVDGEDIPVLVSSAVVDFSGDTNWLITMRDLRQ